MMENKVDISQPRNMLIMALVLVISIGIKYGAGDAVSFGPVTLSGIAMGAIAGILLNVILPERKNLAD